MRCGSCDSDDGCNQGDSKQAGSTQQENLTTQFITCYCQNYKHCIADSAYQTADLLQMQLQVKAVDNIFSAGDEAAATVSPYMREMRARERAVEAVNDMIGSQSVMDAVEVSLRGAQVHSLLIVQGLYKLC